jgi:hypothetical protein
MSSYTFTTLCVVCSKAAAGPCSRCKDKLIQYCSFNCQSADWNNGHKQKCVRVRASKKKGKESVTLKSFTFCCVVCGQSTDDNGKRYCGRCKDKYTRYCSKVCQRIHWKGGHKANCVAADATSDMEGKEYSKQFRDSIIVAVSEEQLRRKKEAKKKCGNSKCKNTQDLTRCSIKNCIVHYCSKGCQTTHWPDHKPRCGKLPTPMVTTASDGLTHIVTW